MFAMLELWEKMWWIPTQRRKSTTKRTNPSSTAKAVIESISAKVTHAITLSITNTITFYSGLPTIFTRRSRIQGRAGVPILLPFPRPDSF
jgi:hypothetical protein